MQTSFDDFLGGMLTLQQPISGYRAGVDPVLLAAACTAQAGQSVLELGTGAGAAALCLQARVGGVHLAGLEIQPEYIELAQQNAAQFGTEFDLRLGDVAARPAVFADRNFDHVIANPPYFKSGNSVSAQDTGRAMGRASPAPLSIWVAAAAKRLHPKGYLTLIQRIERLPDFITACDGILGSITICPITPRTGHAPHLFLAQARKGGRAAFRMAPSITMHAKPHHEKDGEDYSPQISQVLRRGAALPCFS